MKQNPGEPGFEWYVAWRYLEREKESRWWLGVVITGAVILLAGAALLFLPTLLHSTALQDNWLARSDRRRLLQLVGIIAIFVGFTVAYVGFCVSRFSIFTTISMFGVYLGVAAPIIVLSVMSGFETDLKAKIIGQNAHIVITAPERAWQGWEGDLEQVRRDPGVKAATPYLESEVLVQAQTNNQGVEFRGIDPQSVSAVTDLGRQMEVGELDYLTNPEKVKPNFPILEADDKGKDRDKDRPREEERKPTKRVPGILVGTELARNLRIYPGDDVDVACLACGMGPTGALPNLRTFRVAGIFKTGMYEFDTKIAYTTIADAQKFLALPGEITGIEIKTTDLNKSDQTADRLRTALGKGFDVKDWREMNASLFSALKMEKIAMFIVLAFIVLVASFSIISTLIMVAVEKAREIAILKSMGASDLGVVRIFLFQGLYIGAIGLLAGVISGLGACGLLYRFGIALDSEVYYIARLPVHIDVLELLAIAACAVGISCLATIYPAFLAARMRPVEGLRYE